MNRANRNAVSCFRIRRWRRAMNYVDIYQEDEEYPHEELLELLGVERKKLWQKHTSQEKK